MRKAPLKVSQELCPCPVGYTGIGSPFLVQMIQIVFNGQSLGTDFFRQGDFLLFSHTVYYLNHCVCAPPEGYAFGCTQFL